MAKCQFTATTEPAVPVKRGGGRKGKRKTPTHKADPLASWTGCCIHPQSEVARVLRESPKYRVGASEHGNVIATLVHVPCTTKGKAHVVKRPAERLGLEEHAKGSGRGVAIKWEYGCRHARDHYRSVHNVPHVKIDRGIQWKRQDGRAGSRKRRVRPRL